MAENVDNFIRVSRTPVMVGNFPLRGFIVGDLAGVGPGNKEELRNQLFQISYKKIFKGAEEKLHGHSTENNEFVFVLNGDWGPININGEEIGVVKPGEFTLIKGDRTFLQWRQERERAKVLVIKEPSVNDKRSVAEIDLDQANPNFTKDNFVELARNNKGLVASPDQANESLRTKVVKILYFQNDFSFKPDFPQEGGEVIVLVMGGKVTITADGKTIDLSAGGMMLVSKDQKIELTQGQDFKLFIVKY